MQICICADSNYALYLNGETHKGKIYDALLKEDREYYKGQILAEKGGKNYEF